MQKQTMNFDQTLAFSVLLVYIESTGEHEFCSINYMPLQTIHGRKEVPHEYDLFQI